MLSKELKKQYLINENKYILPSAGDTDNRDLAATVAANFASLTYRIPNEDVETLSKATTEDIVAFYREYYPVLEEQIGANHEYHAFYPNFPEDVMKREDVDFFFEQILYGITGFEIRPEVYEEAITRMPYMGYQASHRLTSGSEKDYLRCIKEVMASPIAYTPRQREYIISFLKEYPNAERYIPSMMNNHENRIVLACTLLDEKLSKDTAKSLLGDANDIIKYAAVRSAQEDYAKNRGNIVEVTKNAGHTYQKEDFYRYASLRFPKSSDKKILCPTFKLSRFERNFIVSTIEENAILYGEKSLEQAMMNNKKIWKKLIKNIHISDYPDAYLTREAFNAISTNKPIERTTRTVEEAIKVGDMRTALEASAKQPGDFIRRTDKFIRMGIKRGDISPVFETLRDVAEHASIATLTSLSAHIKQRTEKNEYRIFNIPSTNRRYQIEDNRITFTPMIADMVHSACVAGIEKQMHGKDIFSEADAKIYISPKTSDYCIPSNVRNMSSGIHTYTQGSKVDVSSKSDFIRLFIWWTNTESARVDLDLAVNLYDKNGQLVEHCGWNTKYKLPGTDEYAVLFSGDVQNGGDIDGAGVAEFMDLNMPALNKLGIKYIVPTVHSFCGQTFYSMKNVAFGWMDRDSCTEDGMDGSLFEPSTVETKYDLNSSSTASVPCVFEILEKNDDTKGNENLSMVWMDTSFDGQIATEDKDTIVMDLNMIARKPSMDVAELIKINARANEISIVDDPIVATYLFITEKELEELKEIYPDMDFSEKHIISPNDINYIMGTLMVTAKELPKKECA